MKKIACFLLALAVLGGLHACGNSGVQTRGSGGTGSSVSQLMENAAQEGAVSPGAEQTPSGAAVPSVETQSGDAENADTDVDVDLTKLGSTMVYSEVYNMMSVPEEYVGKTIKMSGTFSLYEGETRNYYACVIADATACCAQGIEFVRRSDYRYPEDYPAVGDPITVVGVFDTYYEGADLYCQLIDAEASW